MVITVQMVCFDIGNTTRFALEQYLTVGPSWYGNTEKHTAGNASIIVKPLSLFFVENHCKAFYEAKNSIATHGAEESINACNFKICLHMINGSNKDFVFSPHVLPLQRV
jgi:hypothetical protein